MLATDDKGDVWLIEAKLCSNPELEQRIWHRQIDFYRQSIMKRSTDSMILASRTYILSLPSLVVGLSSTDTTTNSLFQAFLHWGTSKGLCLGYIEDIYNGTFQKLKYGDVISTVLADVYNSKVWDSRESLLSNGGFAYIMHDQEATNVLFDQKISTSYRNEVDLTTQTWTQLLRKKNEIIPRPDTVGLYLADSILEMYNSILLELAALGWDAKAKSNKKAFVFDLPTIYNEHIRIHIGWVDADGSLDIAYRTLHHFGLKFNLDFRFMKKNRGLTSICKDLIDELISTANYSIRGKRAGVQSVRQISDYDFESWDGEMFRRRDVENRDYIGRTEEANDLSAVFSILHRIVFSE